SVPSTLLNPDLKPEKITSWEAGADLAFFNNRLSMDFTYYTADNENQIFGIALPISSGYSSKNTNAGLLTSTGIEAGLNATIIDSNDWRWDMGFVFNRNRTKVVEFAEGMNSIRFWTDARGGAITWVGEEIGNIFDAALVRVEDPNSPYFGWPIIDDSGFESSDRTREDADGKRPAPTSGNLNPGLTLGMATTASYTNSSITLNCDWRTGRQFVSQTPT